MKSLEKFNLSKKDLPHIPLFWGGEPSVLESRDKPNKQNRPVDLVEQFDLFEFVLQPHKRNRKSAEHDETQSAAIGQEQYQ